MHIQIKFFRSPKREKHQMCDAYPAHMWYKGYYIYTIFFPPKFPHTWRRHWRGEAHCVAYFSAQFSQICQKCKNQRKGNVKNATTRQKTVNALDKNKKFLKFLIFMFCCIKSLLYKSHSSILAQIIHQENSSLR